jgi:hypothetical protein
MDEVTRLALELAWQEAYEQGYADGGYRDYYPEANPYTKRAR